MRLYLRGFFNESEMAHAVVMQIRSYYIKKRLLVDEDYIKIDYSVISVWKIIQTRAC